MEYYEAQNTTVASPEGLDDDKTNDYLEQTGIIFYKQVISIIKHFF